MFCFVFFLELTVGWATAPAPAPAALFVLTRCSSPSTRISTVSLSHHAKWWWSLLVVQAPKDPTSTCDGMPLDCLLLLTSGHLRPLQRIALSLLQTQFTWRKGRGKKNNKKGKKINGEKKNVGEEKDVVSHKGVKNEKAEGRKEF